MPTNRTYEDLDDGTELDAAPLDDTEEMPYATLMKMLTGDDESGDEDVAFGKGSDAPEAKEPDQVSIEEGVALIDEASTKGRQAAKVEVPKPEAPADDSKLPEPEAKTDDTQPPAAPADIDAMLDGLPDDRKTAARDRITAADEVLAVFKGREAEFQRHGAKPAEVVKRLADLVNYAEQNPHDYLAWAATQFGNPAEVLGKAAEKLGLKVVQVEAGDDDDPFEDPEVKEMRKQLAEYKARERPAPLGPDSPQARAQAELTSLAASLPHWQTVAPQVAALSQAHAARGTPPTIADVKRFYDGAVVAAGLAAPAPQPVSAAQPAPAVAQVPTAKPAATADRIERSKRASMSLDGSGQGAGRRPDLDPDASIATVLTTLWNEQSRKG